MGKALGEAGGEDLPEHDEDAPHSDEDKERDL